MSESIPAACDYADLEKWISDADADPRQQLIRRVIRIILNGIAHSTELRELMVIKGGVLLATAYNTGRHTIDVDFSTRMLVKDIDIDRLCQKLDQSIESGSQMLDESLVCRVQSHKLQPPSLDSTFPTLRIRIGYAQRGSKAFARLAAGASPQVVIVDLSFNEDPGDPVSLKIDGHGVLKAYSLESQIAEKFRALIQQQERYRGRIRRQDAFDIYQVLQQGHFVLLAHQLALLEKIVRSCRSRDIEVDKHSLATPEVRQRAAREYDQLRVEIDGELPDFNQVFDRVSQFYSELPWETQSG
jgi:predicted nucleotidyltransferase component of viral defense system